MITTPQGVRFLPEGNKWEVTLILESTIESGDPLDWDWSALINDPAEAMHSELLAGPIQKVYGDDVESSP